MAITNKIISFWKQVRLKSSDMFTLFKVGIGVKVPTHKLHVKDSVDPMKLEGVQSDTSSSTKLLVLDSDNVIKHGTVTNLSDAGVSGAANQLLTDDGDGTVTSESELTFSDDILELGGDDATSITIQRKTHGDSSGGQLVFRAGDGTGTNVNGGNLRFHGGRGTGSGDSGEIRFSVSSSVSSGTTQHTDPFTRILTLTNASATVAGNIVVSGTVDGVDIAARDHAAVTLANTNYLSLSGQQITGGTVPVGSGGTGATTFTSGQILRGNGTSALTSDSNLTFNGSNFVVASSTSAKPAIYISNTNSDAEAPLLIFDRTSIAGADGDDIGKIRFDAEDDSGSGPHTYAQILGEIVTSAAGSVGGKLTLSIASHDGELVQAISVTDGDAEDEVDVTIGNTATSVTTIAGTLTMGSTAFVNNSGVIQVATQGTIDHDSLANFVANEHIDWTGASAGTIHSSNIPTLNQDTTGNATTATNLTAGDKTLGGIYTAKGYIVDGDRNITPGADGVALHLDSNDYVDNVTSATGTNSTFRYASFEAPRVVASNASVTTTTAATVYIGGPPFASTNQTFTNTYPLYVNSGDAYFGGDIIVAGNDIKDDDGTTCITFDSSGNTAIAGDLTVTGTITGKQKQIYQQSFIDDLGTTKHYLPWKDINEQTTIYQEEVAMVAPYDGRIVSVTIRMSSVATAGNGTIGIHTIGPNTSQFSTGSWTEEEVEQVAIENTDDNHVFYFVFDNAKHFESGELVVLSIQDDTDLHSGQRYTYVSTVVEWDYNNGLGTGSSSAEFDSAQ